MITDTCRSAVVDSGDKLLYGCYITDFFSLLHDETYLWSTISLQTEMWSVSHKNLTRIYAAWVSQLFLISIGTLVSDTGQRSHLSLELVKKIITIFDF